MVSFVGSDSGQVNGGTNISLTLPSHQSDDVGIIFCVADETGTVPDWSVTVATGWTRLRQDNPTTGRDRVCAIFYKRFTSGSETNPTATCSISEEISASVHVFRDVDTVDLFDVAEEYNFGQNDTTPINPPISTATDNACLVLFHAATHDDITVAGLPATPSGLALGETVLGGTNDHRHQFTSYLTDAGSAGTTTPTAWTHTSSPTGTAEWTVYTLALRDLQPVHISDVNTDEKIAIGEQDVVVTGDGFEAVQGTGKIELVENQDYTGTIVLQTIDSWSATSIQFDSVQGALADGIVYLFVTNDSGERSAGVPVAMGLLPYDEVMKLLTPDHWWQLDNSYDDDAGVLTRNMTTDVVGTHTFVTSPICGKNTHAWELNGVTERRGCADSANMNLTTPHTERTMGGWIQVDSVQQSLGAFYKEGGGVNNLAFLFGLGNVLMAQLADTGDDNVQAYSDYKLAVDRPYHIAFRYSYNEGTPEFRLFIDGVEQEVTDGNPLTSTNLDPHSGDINWGDPDSNLEMGGTDIAFAGTQGCRYAQWATWRTALDKTTEIREQLFEKGALPDVTISSDTEANMQIALDALADTVRPDWPLCIRVEPLSGGGDFKLTADNVSFDARASIHVQYTGGDTLTWVNANGSDASIVSTPEGGTVTIVKAVQIAVTVRDIADNSLLQNARVYMLAGSGGPLSQGTVIFNGLTDVSGQITLNLEFTSNQPITGYVRKSSGSPRFQQSALSGTVTANGFAATIFMVGDE